MVLDQIMFSRKNFFISFDSIEGRKHRSSGSSHWLKKVASNTIFQQMSDICVPQLFLPLNQSGNFRTNVQFISEVGANSVISNTIWFTRDETSQEFRLFVISSLRLRLYISFVRFQWKLFIKFVFGLYLKVVCENSAIHYKEKGTTLKWQPKVFSITSRHIFYKQPMSYSFDHNNISRKYKREIIDLRKTKKNVRLHRMEKIFSNNWIVNKLKI